MRGKEECAHLCIEHLLLCRVVFVPEVLICFSLVAISLDAQTGEQALPTCLVRQQSALLVQHALAALCCCKCTFELQFASAQHALLVML